MSFLLVCSQDQKMKERQKLLINIITAGKFCTKNSRPAAPVLSVPVARSGAVRALKASSLCSAPAPHLPLPLPGERPGGIVGRKAQSGPH